MIDLFEQAFKIKDEQLAQQKEAGEFTPFTPIDIKGVGLELDQYVVIRILGIPMEVRDATENPQFNPKLILQSEIVKDDKLGYIQVNWPFVIGTGKDSGKYIPDPNWFLSRVMKKVRDAKWIKFTEEDVDNVNIIMKGDGTIIDKKTEKNGKFVYFNENKNCFPFFDKTIRQNASPNEYPKTFYPSRLIMMNVLHKNDPEQWCQKNKHSKLLCKNITIKDDKIYMNKGILYSTYIEILNHFNSIKKVNSGWDIDCIIKKYESTVNMYKYEIRTARDIDIFNEDLQKVISSKPLTEEEKKYELYDLDALFPVTSYTKLKNNISGLIKLVDSELGTDFILELEELVKEENLKKDKNKKLENNNHSVNPVTVDIKKNENKIEENNNERKSRQEDIKTEEKDENYFISIFPYWSKITTEDKEDMIKYVKSVDGKNIIYKQGTKLVPCDEISCKVPLPELVSICPVCGKKF